MELPVAGVLVVPPDGEAEESSPPTPAPEPPLGALGGGPPFGAPLGNPFGSDPPLGSVPSLGAGAPPEEDEPPLGDDPLGGSLDGPLGGLLDGPLGGLLDGPLGGLLDGLSVAGGFESVSGRWLRWSWSLGSFPTFWGLGRTSGWYCTAGRVNATRRIAAGRG